MKQRATNAGAYLYRLTKKLQEQEARFQKLLENAPPYMGQTELWIIDQLTNYYKRTQRAKANADDTAEELREVEKDVLDMMERYLELPPDCKLTAKLPGQAIFEIWYDEQRMVHCEWTEIEPEPENPNIIYIKMSDYDDDTTKRKKKKGVVEEEEDDDDDIDDDTMIANIKKLYNGDGQPIKRREEDLNIVPEWAQYPNGREEEPVYKPWDPNKDYTQL